MRGDGSDLSPKKPSSPQKGLVRTCGAVCKAKERAAKARGEEAVLTPEETEQDHLTQLQVCVRRHACWLLMWGVRIEYLISAFC